MDTNTELTARYVRKPFFVEAVQVTAENFTEVCRWCFGKIKNQNESPYKSGDPIEPAKQYIQVRVSNPRNPRQTKACVGDWILYSEMGFKVYSTKAFRASFDPAEDDGTEIVPIENDMGPVLQNMENTL